MKINQILIILIIVIVCVTAAVYITRAGVTPENSPAPGVTTVKTTPPAVTPTPNTTGSLPKSSVSDSSPGHLVISIGNYSAQLPVTIDNKKSGSVSKGSPLKINLNEGIHSVSVCSDTLCESFDVSISSAMKTTVDLEERLTKDLPQGTLNVSIGDYPVAVPVLIDNVSVGNASPSKPLSVTLSSGGHLVKLCNNNNDCDIRVIGIIPANQTIVDFGDWLKSGITRADVTVSIGGFDAQLPVLIDNVTVGTVSHGVPLTTRVNTGEHLLKVCTETLCENETINVYFSKPLFIDFGERLQRDVEFTSPTARIVKSEMNGNTLLIDVEFINPGTTEKTITADVSCVYTYIDSTRTRVSTSVHGSTTKVVKAGTRLTQQMTMSASGSNVILTSDPVINDITIK